MADRVVDKAREMLGDIPEEPTAEEPETEEPTGEAPEQPDPEDSALPVLEPELTDEQRELLEEPDFEAEAQAEIQAEQPEEEEDEYEAYDESPQLQAERAARIAAEKRAAWLEGQRVKESSKSWREEAKKVAALSEPFLDEIKATSRKGYIREAKRIHDKLAPFVKEHYHDPLVAARAQMSGEVTAEAREEAARAWGKPTSGPSVVPAEAAEQAARVDQARIAKNRSFDSIVKTMIFPDKEGANA